MPWQPELQLEGEDGVKELLEAVPLLEVIEAGPQAECVQVASRDSAPRPLLQQCLVTVGQLKHPLAEPFIKRPGRSSSARSRLLVMPPQPQAGSAAAAAPMSSEEEVADDIVDDDEGGVDLEELEDRIWRDQLRLRRLKEKRTGATGTPLVHRDRHHHDGDAEQAGSLTHRLDNSQGGGTRSHGAASGDRASDAVPSGRTTSNERPEGVSSA